MRLMPALVAVAVAVPASLALLPAGTIAAHAPVSGPAVHTDVHDRSVVLNAVNPSLPKATWDPGEYDDMALNADAPDLPGATGQDLPDVHGVYIHASDQPSRFGTYAAYFQAEQKRASGFLTGSLGMAFRWDERLDADARRLHDITVVRSGSNMRNLSSTKQFGLVGDALRAAGLTDPDKKYYVWLDAKSTNCGQGQSFRDTQRSAANAANSSTYAVSYRPTGGEEMYAANGGWCNPVLHELTHGMGAVAEHMPNHNSGGHCDDDAQDTMCNATLGPVPFDSTAPRTYDGGANGGNDDYVDPRADLRNADTAGTLPWWTVNLSRFLCPRSALDRAVPDCDQPNNPYYGPVAPTEPETPPTTKPTKGGGKR